MARLSLVLGLLLLAAVGATAEDNDNEGVMLRVRVMRDARTGGGRLVR